MERKEFLLKTGELLISMTILPCLFSCAQEDEGDGKNLTGNITLSAEQKAILDSQGFLNLDGVMVLRVGTEYRAFGRRCPHQGGTVTAINATTLQCQKHTDQYYNTQGQGNGARTSASLVIYTTFVDDSGNLVIQA